MQDSARQDTHCFLYHSIVFLFVCHAEISCFIRFSWLGYPATSLPIEGLTSLSFELVGWETSGHDGLGTYGYTGLGICVRMFQ
jgi:hypothetical protein